MTTGVRQDAIRALEEFGCAPAVLDVIRELPEDEAVYVEGRSTAYQLVLTEPGTASAMHAHRDRLYLRTDPDDAPLLVGRHGGSRLPKSRNQSTAYISWSSEQLAEPETRAAVVEGAVRALHRAAARRLERSESGTRRAAAENEDCSVCFTSIRSNGICNCPDTW